MIKGYPNKEVGLKKTLADWMQELDIVPVQITFESTGNTYDSFRSSVKKDRNGYIDIYRIGGYGILHSEVEGLLNKTFIMINNDINDAKLVQCYD